MPAMAKHKSRQEEPSMPTAKTKVRDAEQESPTRGDTAEEVPPVIHHQGLTALMAKLPILFYNLGLGILMGSQLLILTTTGRRSGLRRHTPLLYMREGNTYYLISEAGTHADWYRNMAKNPNVEVQVGRQRFAATAERVRDLQLIAQVMRTFNRFSRAAGQMFYGIPRHASDQELQGLAPQRVVVAIEGAAEADVVVEAYCLRCGAKRPMDKPEEAVLPGGRVRTHGRCRDCGNPMSRMGSIMPKPQHDR
jgi:deazaflavin-dependent oxidoreductase (nitroreductase family)